ncbi:MAG: translation elongation factor Ts [Chloroflexota bacterium]|nr:translation elongation factor Ts [Chloroflexota bacterium]
MQVSTETIKSLRESTGAGIMDCRKALLDAQGDMEKASQILREKGLAVAAKKSGRATGQGRIEVYIHGEGKIGSMVEANCETDFVARTQEFRELVHNLALQVAATNPRWVSPEEAQGGDPKEDCLLLQPYIRQPDRSVQDLINEVIAKTGENIRVRRFARFELGN